MPRNSRRLLPASPRLGPTERALGLSQALAKRVAFRLAACSQTMALLRIITPAIILAAALLVVCAAAVCFYHAHGRRRR